MSALNFKQISLTGNAPPLTSKRITVYSVMILIALVGILYWIFRRKAKEALVMGPFHFTDTSSRTVGRTRYTQVLDTEQQILTTSNNITCSFFVYVDHPRNENLQLHNDGDATAVFPLLIIGRYVGVVVDPVRQRCGLYVIQSGPWKDATQNTPKLTMNQISVIQTRDVFISKWNQITVTIEGRSVDIYVNGVLASSAQMDNVPYDKLTGITLNTSPDFFGQAALFQMWPERRTSTQILENYKRNTDTRGKPLIPESGLTLFSFFTDFKKNLCRTTGFCGFSFEVAPLEYVDYEFA